MIQIFVDIAKIKLKGTYRPCHLAQGCANLHTKTVLPIEDRLPVLIKAILGESVETEERYEYAINSDIAQSMPIVYMSGGDFKTVYQYQVDDEVSRRNRYLRDKRLFGLVFLAREDKRLEANSSLNFESAESD